LGRAGFPSLEIALPRALNSTTPERCGSAHLSQTLLRGHWQHATFRSGHARNTGYYPEAAGIAHDLRAGDDLDIPASRQKPHGQGIVNHRLVFDRQQLL